MKSINDVPIILRREIEALIAAPLLRAFAKEIGEKKTTEIAAGIIAELAKKAGQDMSKACGGNTLSHFQKVLPAFSQGGALEIEFKEMTENCMKMDVTRCAYVEMYKRNGLSDLGSLLSCQRDAYLFEGFNPNLIFTRTQTIMDGGCCCDFCLEKKPED